MALDCLTENIGMINNLFEGSCEQALDCDISLPDYCPEVLRVLKCCVSPKIVSSKISGDRACADGNALIRIIYADEDNNICTYEQNFPFSKYVQHSVDGAGALFIECDVSYVNCRAVNKRRLEVHGMLHISFKICAVHKREIISTINKNSVQAKTDSIGISNVAACDCKQFTVSETVELPNDYVPAERIINCCATPILNDVRIVKDKILLKGEICVSLIYCTAQNNAQSVKFNHSIPINQVVDADGISEESTANVCLQMLSDECIVRNDANGNPRLIEINCIISAKIKAFNHTQLHCITDAYCIDGELNANYEHVDILNHCNRIHETVSRKNVLDFSSLDIQKICCMWFDSSKLNKSVHNGKLSLNCAIPVNIIALDNDSRPVFCQREFDFDFEKSVENEGNFIGDIAFTNTGHSIGTLTDGKAEVKAEFIIDADVFSSGTAKVLTAADVSPKENKTGASMIIYFPDENESLWNIARRFNTTVDSIKEQNSVSGDNAKQGTPLLIPVAM